MDWCVCVCVCVCGGGGGIKDFKMFINALWVLFLYREIFGFRFRIFDFSFLLKTRNQLPSLF